jgi:DNA-binding transcriptional LysR family regulator
MNFTFHQLRIFLEVKAQKNITKAAQVMYMSQPALSIQLKKFQSQFSLPLVEYAGKKLQITEFGEEIAIVAKKVLKEANQLNYKSKAYEGLLTGSLKISSASTGKYVLPYFLADFVAEYPGIDLQLDVSNKTIVMENLINNEIDFALVSVVPETLAVEEEPLVQNSLFFVSSTMKIDKIKPLIYREPGSATRQAMVNYFKDNSTRKSIQLTSNEAVKQAVIAGLGYSILPLIGIKNEILNNELHIVKRKKLPIHTQWRLIWLSKKEMSPIAKAYLQFVREQKARIIQDHFSWYTDFVGNTL